MVIIMINNYYDKQRALRVVPSDFKHTFQANYLCPCYNYKMYVHMYVCTYMSCIPTYVRMYVHKYIRIIKVIYFTVTEN